MVCFSARGSQENPDWWLFRKRDEETSWDIVTRVEVCECWWDIYDLEGCHQEEEKQDEEV